MLLLHVKHRLQFGWPTLKRLSFSLIIHVLENCHSSRSVREKVLDLYIRTVFSWLY